MVLFHIKSHIPPINPTNDMNMSPVEGYTFAACRSMQNAQILTECGGVNKYVYKFIVKFNEHNFVVVSTDAHKNGSLVTKGTLLHNTKVKISKINEDKIHENRKDSNHAKCGTIIQMEILHVMLKYPEVYTGLNYVAVPTIPFELCVGIEIEK